MKSHHHHLLLLLFTSLLILTQTTSAANDRRILHQPLYPETDPPPPPQTPATTYLNPDIPFSPELPNPDQPTNTPPPPPPPTHSQLNNDHLSAASHSTNPTKKLAIAIPIGIVCLGMLSAFVFFLFRHRAKQSSDAHKLFDDINEAGRGCPNHPPPQSNFLYTGTESSSTRFAAEDDNVANANHSPYHKLTSAEKFTSRYKPSPELQPLPPLVTSGSKSRKHSRSVMSGSSEDDESLDTSFYTPNGSSSDTPVPHSRRTSPKSNLHPPSPPQPPPMAVMIPSIKPMSSLTQQDQNLEDKSHQRPRFPAAPPRPNLTVIPSLGQSQVPLPPPPPPPPQQKEPERVSSKVLQQQLETPISIDKPAAVEESKRDGNSTERQDSDDMEGGKTKLKPLHWDKVRAISHRETVWDHLKSSSFQ